MKNCKILKLMAPMMAGLALTAIGAQVAGAADAAGAKLQIGVKKSELAFDKTVLTVTAGQKVTLVFTNSAPKDSGMGHNWLLINPGKGQEVANAGMVAGPDKGYTPDSTDVLAKTKLLNPGETDTIQFVAPATAGDFPFICTFPGHYPSMKGTLKVK